MPRSPPIEQHRPYDELGVAAKGSPNHSEWLQAPVLLALIGKPAKRRCQVDRLVAHSRRAEELRLEKRKETMAKNEDEEDVTYINENNKQCNQKLARFYDKYTADMYTR
ncbi:hypothetical protein E4U40_005150 [Claviceps sp. LM458 group G5]|nr:hypothetical protein E4U40_005150 [Claviceps sp. LM458 group G5]